MTLYNGSHNLCKAVASVSGAGPEALRQVVGRTDGCKVERGNKWELGKIGQGHQGEMEPLSESLSLQLVNGGGQQGKPTGVPSIMKPSSHKN